MVVAALRLRTHRAYNPARTIRTFTASRRDDTRELDSIPSTEPAP